MITTTATNTNPHHAHLNNAMPPTLPIITTASAPPPSEPILSDTDFIAAAADKISRTLKASPVSHPCSRHLFHQTYCGKQHRPIHLRFTCHRRGLSISLTLPPPAAQVACGGQLSKRVLEEFARTRSMLRVVLFALLVILIVCLFLLLGN